MMRAVLSHCDDFLTGVKKLGVAVVDDVCKRMMKARQVKDCDGGAVTARTFGAHEPAAW